MVFKQFHTGNKQLKPIRFLKTLNVIFFEKYNYQTIENMKHFFRLSSVILILSTALFSSCKSTGDQPETVAIDSTKLGTMLEQYVAALDTTFKYELRDSVRGEGYTTYILYMESQRWLTTNEVDETLWWHWVSVTVPDEVVSDIGLLWIGGGSKNTEQPKDAPGMLVQLALYTKTVTAGLHNIPFQKLTFKGDDFGPRNEDALISYGWKKFIEGGGKDEDAIWLARLPMTKAAVRAMDAVSDFTKVNLSKDVSKYTVFGGSKRGWTTWTTAIVDKRVVAIAPVVIDMLNVVPSFERHWQAYGFWAPAVTDYVREGIMDRQYTEGYQKLISITEPFSYRDRLTIPKFIINASGDEFFLPDSWEFYYSELVGEKHLRYVPNANHGLEGTDAPNSFSAFYKSIVDNTPRPDFNWSFSDGKLTIETGDNKPDSIYFWQAFNPNARDFRVETFGRNWEKEIIPTNWNGKYEMSVITPEKGWKAFYAELVFPGSGEVPFKFSTGIYVTPDSLPYPKYEPKASE